MAAADLTAARLREFLKYDPELGSFTWIVGRKSHAGTAKAGAVAGQLNGNGYRYLGLMRFVYTEHRLAWLYMTGSWPTQQIDHVDGNRSNNKWHNLRQVTAKQNSENRVRARADSPYGVTGVSRIKESGKWRAVLKNNRKFVHLGCFNTLEEAVSARKEGERIHFTHSPVCARPSEGRDEGAQHRDTEAALRESP